MQRGFILLHKNVFLDTSQRRKITIVAVTASILMMVTGAILYAPKANAAADTCTWTGSGGDSNINTAANWSGCDNGTVPQNGDDLVFPTGPTNKTVTINTTLEFNNVTFSGDDYSVETSDPGTNQLYVDNNLTISGNDNTFNAYVRFFDSSSVTLGHSGSGTVFSHYIVIQPTADNTDMVFDIDSDMSVPMIAQTAVGVGSSIDTVTKTGVGTLDITGAGITGVTTNNGVHIEEGRWECDSTHCLGNTANEIILDEGGGPDGAELAINHSGTVSNPITSSATTGEDGSVIISANATLNGDITVNNDLNMFVTGTTTANIDSDIAIADGKNLVSYGVEGYTTNAYDYDGVISGDGGMIVDDAHVTLTGTNTYTGDTEITDTGSGGLVSVTNESGLGTNAGKTIVNSGTTLNFSSGSDQFYDEPLQISGSGVGGSYPAAIVNDNSYRALNGNIMLAGDATVQNNINELVVFGGQISGDFDLSLVGGVENGSFTMGPSTDNTYGDTIATGTQLLIYGGSGIIAIPGNLTMNAVDSHTSRIWMQYDNTIANNSLITLNNSDSQVAYLLNMGVADTVGTIEGDGTISMTDSDSHLLIGAGDTDGTFEGVVEGYTNSQFEIIDSGTWTFSGDNTDVGNGFSSYYVNGGKFIANAINTSLGFSPFSISGGILGGTDVIGPVSVYSGTIAPGNSPGCLNPAGDVAFSDELSTLTVELNGNTICSEYDKLAASGVVYLNDATLNVDLGFDPSDGDVFTIVEGSSIVGTFSGLADGDTFTAGDGEFRINYNAENVTLTYIGPAAGSDSSDSDSSLADTGMNTQALIVIVLFLISSGGLVGINLRKDFFHSTRQ